MRILQICEYYEYIGGTEQYVLSLTKILEDMGHNVSIIYGIKTENTINDNRKNLYFIPEFSKICVLDKNKEEHIKKIIDKESPDIIYVHNISNFYLIEMLSKIKPVVRYIHDHRLFCPKGNKVFRYSNEICEYPYGVNCFFNAYLKRCLPRNPYTNLKILSEKKKDMTVNKKINLIVASGYMKNCLLQNGFDERKINILPYYCKDYGYDERHFDNFILFVGRIWLYKGLQFLIKALKNLPQSLKLVIAGEGDYLDDMKSLTADLGLGERVIFLGRISNDDLKQYYSNCLALVVPSIWAEPFGIIGIEAMASGKPVIAFDVGGISDWLEDNKSGFLVERENVAGLVEKINLFLNNRELATKMGDYGRKLYEEKYTQKYHIEKLLEIFKLIKKNYENNN